MPKGLLDRSPDIETMVPYWDMVTDIITGEEAITKAGEKYLPKFPGESKDDYAFRVENGKFTNIFRDTLEGLATKPFQDEVTVVGNAINDKIKGFVEDVDGCGNNLSSFAALTFFIGIGYAIDWIFVDYPTTDNTVMNREEAREGNLKPYWRHILGKNVLEVRSYMKGSKEIISYFRYQEPSYGEEPIRVRVYAEEYDELGRKHIMWHLYQKLEKTLDNGEDFIEIANGEMSIGFIPVVPFITGHRDGNRFSFFPVMKDAADLQISLYRDESALQYIKVLACYPMLATDGLKPKTDANGKPERIAVGPGRVLYGAPLGNGAGGTWKYVEPQANSLEFLKKDIDKTKQDLRELGRQPLTALSSQLTTVTTSIAAGKAKSAVTTWALGLKDALENALLITLQWENPEIPVDEQPEVNVYTGFDNVLEDGSDLEQLGKARERRDISLETYWEELKRRKILSAEFTAEREKKRLLEDIPVEELDSEDEANLNQDNLTKEKENGMETR